MCRFCQVAESWPPQTRALHVQVLPGGRILASTDESGQVAACDMRMLGGTLGLPGAPGGQKLLWSLNPPGGGITCLEAGLHPASGTYPIKFHWAVSMAGRGMVEEGAVSSGHYTRNLSEVGGLQLSCMSWHRGFHLEAVLHAPVLGLHGNSQPGRKPHGAPAEESLVLTASIPYACRV